MPLSNRAPDLFPIATREGTQINYDVARPTIVTAIAATLVAEAAYGITDRTQLFVIMATDDVQVLFDAGTPALTKARGLVVGADERVVLVIPQDVSALYVKALNADCNVYIHEMGTWHGLTTAEATQIG